MSWRTSGKFGRKAPGGADGKGLPPGRRHVIGLDPDSFEQIHTIVWGPQGQEYRVIATDLDRAIARAWKFHEHPFVGRTTEQQWIDAVRTPRVPLSLLWSQLISIALDELTMSIANKVAMRMVLLSDHPEPGVEPPPVDLAKRLVIDAANLSNDAMAGMGLAMRQLAVRFELDGDGSDDIEELPGWRKVFETCAAAWEPRLLPWYADVRKDIEKVTEFEFTPDIHERHARALDRAPAARILLTTAAIHDLHAGGKEPIPRSYERNVLRALAGDSYLVVYRHFSSKNIVYSGFLSPADEIRYAHERACEALAEHDAPLWRIVLERFRSALEPALPPT